MLARACRQAADGVHGIVSQNRRLVDAGDALTQIIITFRCILKLVRNFQHPRFGISWHELFQSDGIDNQHVTCRQEESKKLAGCSTVSGSSPAQSDARTRHFGFEPRLLEAFPIRPSHLTLEPALRQLPGGASSRTWSLRQPLRSNMQKPQQQNLLSASCVKLTPSAKCFNCGFSLTCDAVLMSSTITA